MKKYRLYDSKDAKFFIIMPWVLVLFCSVLTPLLLLLIRNYSTALLAVEISLSLLIFFVLYALIMLNHYGKCAILEGGTLTICTAVGRRIRTFRLDEMNKACVFISHIRYGECSKSLLLCHKDLVLEVELEEIKGECLPHVNLSECRAKDKKMMVAIVNKELEEKILAYYGEPITEPDTTV